MMQLAAAVVSKRPFLALLYPSLRICSSPAFIHIHLHSPHAHPRPNHKRQTHHLNKALEYTLLLLQLREHTAASLTDWNLSPLGSNNPPPGKEQSHMTMGT
jgi:hypothetical protein